MGFPVVLADWLDTLDQINDAVSHPDFNATVHNPWFIIGALIFCVVAFLRGWKALLIVFLGGMAAWYVIANVVMADKTGAGSGGGVIAFAAAIAGIGGFLIYFLLIRD